MRYSAPGIEVTRTTTSPRPFFSRATEDRTPPRPTHSIPSHHTTSARPCLSTSPRLLATLRPTFPSCKAMQSRRCFVGSAPLSVGSGTPLRQPPRLSSVAVRTRRPSSRRRSPPSCWLCCPTILGLAGSFSCVAKEKDPPGQADLARATFCSILFSLLLVYSGFVIEMA